MSVTIKIGTRKSPLALWQAKYVAESLQKRNVLTELIPIETMGDQILDVSIAKIGSKGVFTEDLEKMLKNGDIDMAVHSAKDVQAILDDELDIIAFTEREMVNDMLISHLPVSMQDLLVGIKIGTSSTRRVAFIRHYFPNCEVVSVRGNLQTRIQKMQSGVCDALILAYAGVHRMGYHHLIRHVFPANEFIPPVGQGTLAIEIHQNLSAEKKSVIQTLDDPKAHICLTTERSFLKTLQGGCSIPSFGFAQAIHQSIVFKAGLIHTDGSQLIQNTWKASTHDAEKLGINAAHWVLNHGGQEILASIRSSLP